MTALVSRTLHGRLEQVVTTQLERMKVPGAAVGVFKDGQIETFAFGVANLASGARVTPDTLFQIGSITKVFTATAVMQLVDRWKLELDAPVVRYLPDFRLSDEHATEKLLVRHLLTHYTGFFGDDFTDYGVGPDALGRAVAALSAVRQLTMPGELWSYCNAGFQVLGTLLEKYFGQPAEDAIRAHVLKPLGLEDSTFRADEAITHSAAVGYNTLTTEEPEVARPYAITRAMNPAGAIIGTVGDLLKFAAFHMGNGTAGGKRILSPAAVAAMQTQQATAANMAPAWGLGWWVKPVAGTHIIGHGGSTNGQRANLAVVPSRRIAVASLTNGSSGAFINREIERVVFEQLDVPVEFHERVRLDSAQLGKFAGRYHAPGGDVVVAVEGAGLRLDTYARNALTGAEYQAPPREALAIGPATFEITNTEMEGSQFDFISRTDGTVRFLRLGGRLYEPAVSATID